MGGPGAAAAAAVALAAAAARELHGLPPIEALPPLPRLGASGDVSVSGISSGADFAVYFSLAHSASVVGAGVFAGNVYRCYQTRFPGDHLVPCASMAAKGYATAGCTNVDPDQAPCDASAGLPCPPDHGLMLSKCQGCAGPGSGVDVANVNVSALRAVAVRHAAEGRIDPVANVARNRYYLYRGGRDPCYTPASVAHAAELYKSLGAAVSFSNSTVPSLHAIPTVATGTPCGVEGNYTEAAPHGLEACGYSGAYEALRWIHPGISPPAASADPDALVRFNQSGFGSPRAGLDLARGGFAYIPKRCRRSSGGKGGGSSSNGARSDGQGRTPPCRVHVFLHGCGQQAAAGPTPYAMNDTYARRAGFNEVAEANGFVVIYPQISYGDRALCASERGGCWDQTGTTGDAYSSKVGAQVKAVKAVIDRVSESERNLGSDGL